MRPALALLLGSFWGLSSASPIWTTSFARPAVGRVYQSLQETTQFFLTLPEPRRVSPPAASRTEIIPPPETVPEPRRQKFRYDAQEESIGVVFTTADDQVLHLWIPLKRRLHTRDSPILPLHPRTARITTMIHTSPSLAAPEQLSKIRCRLRLYNTEDGVQERSRGEGGEFAFSKVDELVRFDEASASNKFWLDGKEVESYECS